MLRKTAAHARTKPNRVAEEFTTKTATMPKTTEAERLESSSASGKACSSAAVGLLQGKRCVTGLDVPELLRARTSAPGLQCETDEQRLTCSTALLAPHLTRFCLAALHDYRCRGSGAAVGWR